MIRRRMTKIWINSENNLCHDFFKWYGFRRWFKRKMRKEPELFITSDNHFYHRNIIRYCNRPFNSVNEMNETMIRNWNKIVSKKDIVFHLGDFAMTRNFRDIIKLRKRLNGTIILLNGNHDKYFHKMNRIGFKTVYGKIRIGNLILTHRPMLEVPKGYYNVHGHIHDKKTYGERLNVSVDNTDFEPTFLNRSSLVNQLTDW